MKALSARSITLGMVFYASLVSAGLKDLEGTYVAENSTLVMKIDADGTGTGNGEAWRFLSGSKAVRDLKFGKMTISRG